MISAAMIVRNEQAHLARCLESIKKVANEIVIVDTGSTDKTVEIAEEYTKNIYNQKWTDNFSLHRNYSFSKCTNDWIIQIDADEELIFDKDIAIADFKYWLHQRPDNVNAVCIKLKPSCL